MHRNFFVADYIDKSTPDWRLRLVHGFLFSLNISLVVRLGTAQTSSSSLETSLQAWINAMLNLHPHSNMGGYTAFLR
jgi:hypothetical protein